MINEETIEAMKEAERFCDEVWAAMSILIRPRQADAKQAETNGSKYCAEITYGGQGAHSGPCCYGFTPHEAIHKALKEAKWDSIKNLIKDAKR